MTKFAAVQMTSGHDVSANLAVAIELLTQARAAGAEVALLPENFAFMGLRDSDKRAIAETEGEGPIQQALSNAAAQLGMWVIAGTIPLRVANEERPGAACVVFDDRGRHVARYDKIHLFDVDIPGREERYRESANLAPGKAPVVVDTPAGRVGLSVCYDVRFPELFRRLSLAGAEILVVPAAFTTPTGQAHWETLLRARAIENLSYVVAAAQWGRHPNGRDTYGDSLVIDFWGRVLTRLAAGTGVVVADIDRSAMQQARDSFPALSHRKFDLATPI